MHCIPRPRARRGAARARPQLHPPRRPSSLRRSPYPPRPPRPPPLLPPPPRLRACEHTHTHTHTHTYTHTHEHTQPRERRTGPRCARPHPPPPPRRRSPPPPPPRDDRCPSGRRPLRASTHTRHHNPATHASTARGAAPAHPPPPPPPRPPPPLPQSRRRSCTPETSLPNFPFRRRSLESTSPETRSANSSASVCTHGAAWQCDVMDHVRGRGGGVSGLRACVLVPGSASAPRGA